MPLMVGFSVANYVVTRISKIFNIAKLMLAIRTHCPIFISVRIYTHYHYLPELQHLHVRVNFSLYNKYDLVDPFAALQEKEAYAYSYMCKENYLCQYKGPIFFSFRFFSFYSNSLNFN